jgi:hypothetical protein
MDTFLADKGYEFVGEIWKNFVLPTLIYSRPIPITSISGPGFALNSKFIAIEDFGCYYTCTLHVWYLIGLAHNPAHIGTFFDDVKINNIGSSACCTGVTENTDLKSNKTDERYFTASCRYWPLRLFGRRSPAHHTCRSWSISGNYDEKFVVGWAANLYVPLFPFLSTRKHDDWEGVLPLQTFATQAHTSRWPDHLTTWLGACDYNLQGRIQPNGWASSNILCVLRGTPLQSLKPWKGARLANTSQVFKWDAMCAQGHAIGLLTPDSCPSCQLISNHPDHAVKHEAWPSTLSWIPTDSKMCAVVLFAPRGLFPFDVEREAAQWATSYLQDRSFPTKEQVQRAGSMSFWDVYSGCDDLLRWEDKIWVHR